jgi:hypothetical protein
MLRRKWKNNIKMDIWATCWERRWIELAQYHIQLPAWYRISSAEISGSVTYMADCWIVGRMDDYLVGYLLTYLLTYLPT